MSLFPTGIEQFIVGGLLVGLGISFVFLMTGQVAGASTFFTSAWGYFFKKPFFQQEKFVSTRNWRTVLAVSLIVGGFLYIVLFNNGQRIETSVQWWRLLIGGILVGIGTRMADGCPSGHGICGISSMDKVSFKAVAVFLTVAIVIAYIVNLLGVSP